MKRFFSLLLVLLLLGSAAFGDTVREQIGAPEHAEGEFQSPSGKTHVYVDADVLIPDVEMLNTYSVQARTFTREEAEKGVLLHFGPGQYMDCNSCTTELLFDHSGNVNTWEGYNYGCYVIALDADGVEDGFHSLSVNYVKTLVAGAEYYRGNWFWIYNEHGGQSGNWGSIDDARAVADAFVGEMWPYMVYYGTDPNMSEGLKGRISGQTGYRFYYVRPVDGVLVTPVHQEGAYDRYQNGEGNTSFSLPMPYEKLYVDVDADGIFGLRYDYPIDDPVLETENAALLPFSDIWGILKSIAPLTIMSNEKYEALRVNDLHIERIELGYMCVQKKDQPAQYQLVPVWDFFGRKIINDDVYDMYNYSLVTINAMDGTVIDRTYGY